MGEMKSSFVVDFVFSLQTGNITLFYLKPWRKKIWMPERPREFLFNPKRDMTGIITGLLLGIIGLSMILPTGLTLVKTGLGA